MVTSVEEAVEAQKKKSALNRFYWSLLQQNKNLSSSRDGYEESNKRDAGERVVVCFSSFLTFVLEVPQIGHICLMI